MRVRVSVRAASGRNRGRDFSTMVRGREEEEDGWEPPRNDVDVRDEIARSHCGFLKYNDVADARGLRRRFGSNGFKSFSSS